MDNFSVKIRSSLATETSDIFHGCRTTMPRTKFCKRNDTSSLARFVCPLAAGSASESRIDPPNSLTSFGCSALHRGSLECKVRLPTGLRTGGAER